MRTVILASHGHLASGMKNTVEMILGEQEALKAFDAYTTPECNVHDTLEAMLRQADGECVIVAAQPGVRVITGMNLTLVATLLTEEELPLDELVRTGIAEAQASIQQPEFVSKEEDF